ncbi:MAG TPA: hypothetical protein QGH10_08845, partial [Armatimonadota bacterium]|nr:hypothetical protein [Armatimonadota bacterium]
MKRSFALAVVLIALLGLIAATACHADYDKLFRFKNRTATAQAVAFVVLNALEVPTAFYQNATYCPWGDPTVGTATYGGVLCTTMTYQKAGVSIPGGGGANSRARVGWNTADSSCRLSGLYWGTDANGVSITDASEYGTVPGGGELTTVGNNYRWTIYNDTAGELAMTNVEWDIFAAAETLDKDDLVDIATDGIIGKRLQMAGAPAAAAARENAAAFAAFAEGNTAAANAAWGRAETAADGVPDNRGAGRKRN